MSVFEAYLPEPEPTDSLNQQQNFLEYKRTPRRLVCILMAETVPSHGSLASSQA